MSDLQVFRSRLYGSYVSSGQANRVVSKDPELVFKGAKNFSKYIIRRFIQSSPKTIHILDLACGAGPYLYYLKKQGYYNLTGVDISEEQVSIAHSLNLNEVICKDLFSFLESDIKKYDLVLLMDIIEHLEKPELIDLLDLVRSRLNDNGCLILHVPNAEGIFGMRVRYGDLTHELAFTPMSMRQLLHVTGFSNVRCYEDKPVPHSMVAIIRRFMWQIFTIPKRLIFFAETATFNPVFTQNMTVVAQLNKQK